MTTKPTLKTIPCSGLDPVIAMRTTAFHAGQKLVSEDSQQSCLRRPFDDKGEVSHTSPATMGKLSPPVLITAPIAVIPMFMITDIGTPAGIACTESRDSTPCNAYSRLMPIA
jgi:hypothetical protein